jgi:hypothetical protein
VTPNKVIEKVDRLKPNIYTEEDKLEWIDELEGMTKRLVFQWDDIYIKEVEAQLKDGKITQEEYDAIMDKVRQYSYPEDMDRELLIPAPFDDVYGLYVEAKIDYYNKEYGNYNNSALVFDERYTEYKKAYIREHRARG